MKINPASIFLIAFSTSVNYWYNGQFATGLMIGLGIVLLAHLL